MLTLLLPATDQLDAVEVHLEHSLVSLSKWEEEYEKPFFSRDEKTLEEMQDYFLKMILDEKPPPSFFERLEQEHYDTIGAYMNAKRSATWFRPEAEKRGPSEVVTSELIYYWLIGFQIPFQPVESWHINRLMTLIKIAGIKQSKPKPMSRAEQMAHYQKLNEQRRKELGSSG